MTTSILLINAATQYYLSYYVFTVPYALSKQSRLTGKFLEIGTKAAPPGTGLDVFDGGYAKAIGDAVYDPKKVVAKNQYLDGKTVNGQDFSDPGPDDLGEAPTDPATAAAKNVNPYDGQTKPGEAPVQAQDYLGGGVLTYSREPMSLPGREDDQNEIGEMGKNQVPVEAGGMLGVWTEGQGKMWPPAQQNPGLAGKP